MQPFGSMMPGQGGGQAEMIRKLMAGMGGAPQGATQPGIPMPTAQPQQHYSGMPMPMMQQAQPQQAPDGGMGAAIGSLGPLMALLAQKPSGAGPEGSAAVGGGAKGLEDLMGNPAAAATPAASTTAPTGMLSGLGGWLGRLFG